MKPHWPIARQLFILWVGMLLLAAGSAFAFPLHATAGELSSEPLVFAGSGGNLAIVRALAESFGRIRPEIKIEVPASIGSTGGIAAAAQGAVALGLISRPLRDREKGFGLTILPYARTAVVIGAHRDVVDDGITFDELVEIYQGTKTKWRDGREIIVLTREPRDSSIEILERVIPGFQAAYAESQRAKRWRTMFTDQEMNGALAKTAYAIGLADMGTITTQRLPIKVLKVNGTLPTPENVLSGRYTLVKSLAFALRKDSLLPGAKAFVDFVRSPAGTKILRSNGYLPGE